MGIAGSRDSLEGGREGRRREEFCRASLEKSKSNRVEDIPTLSKKAQMNQKIKPKGK